MPILLKRLRFLVEDFYRNLATYATGSVRLRSTYFDGSSPNVWTCPPPKWLNSENGGFNYHNNMVRIRLTSNPANRPVRLSLVFSIPSVVSKNHQQIPTGHRKIEVNGTRLVIGFDHHFEVRLSPNYPANLSQTQVVPQTTLLNPRWGQGHGYRPCYQINGELDRILMTVFQQLLWLDTDQLSGSAFQWNSYDGGTPGLVHQLLLQEMDRLFAP